MPRLPLPKNEKALDDAWLQVARLSSKEKGTTLSIVSKGGLDAGEAESLALASSRRLIVILDDRAARSFAEVMGVTFLGTAGVLFQAFVKKHLTLAELDRCGRGVESDNLACAGGCCRRIEESSGG